jgi:CRISPR-associated protein Csb2
MSSNLCISFRFVQPYPLFHGRGDAGEPEWPPSPMRAFQALLNAAHLRTGGQPLSPEVRSALQTIETLCPSIVAPRAKLCSVGHRAYVPHNQADLVMAAWERGNGDANIASHRIEKDFRPHRIETIGDSLPTLHYLYALGATNTDPAALLSAIRPIARSIHCLGWGIDQVVADATLIEGSSKQLEGERWSPTPRGGRRLRVQRNGSLDALALRHKSFLTRLDNGRWTPVPPLIATDQVRYRRDTDPLPRPHVVFKLLDADGDTYQHPNGKLVHIAGMVRHLAIDAMNRCPPPYIDHPAPWVERYIAGHRNAADESVNLPHAQLSYIPLPSIGHHHTDPAIRRVMIVAPIGDDAILEHIGQCLDGLRLEPERDSSLRAPVFLQRTRDDNVASRYTQPERDHEGYSRWASVTPIILPGHDDHKPDKTRKLIAKALAQSGVDQPCEFDWSPFSYFPKMLPAYEHDNRSRQRGYIRPGYLLGRAAVHLTLRFNADARIPGPIAIGSGRHCGFGLMAGIVDSGAAGHQ